MQKKAVVFSGLKLGSVHAKFVKSYAVMYCM